MNEDNILLKNNIYIKSKILKFNEIEYNFTIKFNFLLSQIYFEIKHDNNIQYILLINGKNINNLCNYFHIDFKFDSLINNLILICQDSIKIKYIDENQLILVFIDKNNELEFILHKPYIDINILNKQNSELLKKINELNKYNLKIYNYSFSLKSYEIKCFKTIQYPDGSLYEGECIDYIKNGFGKMVYPDNSLYEGEFKDDERNGKGKLIFQSGKSYIGDFKNDKFDGFGKLKLSSGSLYKGYFKEGYKEGKGKMIWRKGSGFYEGYFKKDKFCGKGKLNFTDKIYIGEFLNDNKNGFGTEYEENGKINFKGYYILGEKQN